MRSRMLRLAPLFLVVFLLFLALGGAIVRWLWNALLPPLFGWPTIGFWQALGLLALCRILFGGLGMHGGARPASRRRMAERWERMTPEERERFRRGICGRLGFAPPTTESTGE